ncbi:hypothetical protein Cgig2_026371 [Carnegiea gigantea]|uniref:uracil phosphoribosyltransferase n=1 Tax=Carnegiea gigantea TaxID=171969 RepID=A0A9Q1QIJ8_9CARY|nr:hypothetical protein Cgig2_026371 [Carnegiea gigantea]
MWEFKCLSLSPSPSLALYFPHVPSIQIRLCNGQPRRLPCFSLKCRAATPTRNIPMSDDRMLPTLAGEIQTPMAVAKVEFVDPREPVAVVPILRAGLALAEHAASVLPATNTYHLGISRDEETLQPTIYLMDSQPLIIPCPRLPDKFPEGARICVVDPMLATGGTIVKAIELVKERGVVNKQIKVVSAVAAPPAFQKLSEKFPGLHVYTGAIDEVVNEEG